MTKSVEKKYMHFILWGAGKKSQILLNSCYSDCIEAVIDSNADKVGTLIIGKPIINLETYKKNYCNLPVIVTPVDSKPIIDELKSNGIFHYMVLSDCPSEVHFNRGKEHIFEEYTQNFSREHKYLIYGLTVFSWGLFVKLRSRGLQVYLMHDNKVHPALIDIAEQQLCTQFISDLSEIKKNGIDTLILAAPERNEEIISHFPNEQRIELYDLLPVYAGYQNNELLKFKNIHQGQRCFIVATGPSLRYEDLELLYDRHEITIALNRTYLAFPNTIWRPTYYVVEDGLALKQFGEELLSKVECTKFFADSDAEFWDKTESNKAYKFHVAAAVDENRNTKFSDDFVKGTYCGYAVVYVCIQMAVYMGFSEIYLIGVDFSYKGLCQSEGNHFYKDNDSMKIKANPWVEDKVLNAYKSAKHYSESHNVKIYNATRGGKLEVFERRDFDSLFSVN